MDHTTFLGNSVLYLSKCFGISEKLEQLHADYREGKISEEELNALQAPFLQTANPEKAFRALARGPVAKRLDRGVKLVQKKLYDVQMQTFNPFQIFSRKIMVSIPISHFCGNLTDGVHLGAMGDLSADKVELMRWTHVGDWQERYCNL